MFVNYNNATSLYSGSRFTGVSGLAGATINSCAPQAARGAYSNVNVDLHFEMADAPATFATGTNTISGRSLTSASVNWTVSLPATLTEGPSLVTPLEELIAAHNPSAIAMIGVDSQSTVQGSFTPYDSSTSLATKLDIDYTAGGGSSGNPHYYYAQQ